MCCRLSAVQRGDVFHQRQAQAQTSLGAVWGALALCEQVKDAGQQIGCNAAAVVGDLNMGSLIMYLQQQLDLTVLWGVFGGVVQHVGDHLHQPVFIAFNKHQGRGHANAQRVFARVDQGQGLLHRVVKHQFQVQFLLGNLHQTACDARNIQQVIDQAGHVFDLAGDDVACLSNTLLAQSGHFEHLRGGADGGQRVAQFVRQHRQKLVLAFALPLQGFFGQLLLMDVGTCPHPANDLLGLIANRQRTSERPVILPRVVTQAVLDFIHITGDQAVVPERQCPGLVVWMKNIGPSLAVGGIFRHTGKVIPLLIEIVVVAVRQCGPHHLRHGIGDGAKFGFAVAQCGFHAHLRCDVHLRHHRTHHVFNRVPNRFGMQQDGAAFARCAERFDLDDVAG